MAETSSLSEGEEEAVNQEADPRKKSKAECWSVVAAPDKTRIWPTQSFFISTELLLQTKEKFGPGKNFGPKHMKAHWKRYAWELVRHIVGKDKLIACEQLKGIGIGKILKSLDPSETDILAAVMRKYFGEYFPREHFQLVLMLSVHSSY